MREATNNYNGSRRILVRLPEFADAVAGQKTRPRTARKRAGSALAGAGHGCTPLHLEIVDCPRADEAADASFATASSRRRAERNWVADIATLAISARAPKNARGDAPIAKTLDCDLGLVARDLANLRATGHASGDLETQCLGGRLRIRRDRDIDEISHLDLPVSMLSANSARMGGGRYAARRPA
jgi:hypothetical protein